MLNAIAFIAERKIEEALSQGAFDDLPGMGSPIAMEDLSHLPEDLRMAYTMLKTAGYIDAPPKPGEQCNVKELLDHIPDEQAAYSKMQRLKLMIKRMRSSGAANISEAHDPLLQESQYLTKLLDKI